MEAELIQEWKECQPNEIEKLKHNKMYYNLLTVFITKFNNAIIEGSNANADLEAIKKLAGQEQE